jgi:DNA-binding winged helix-turn-helix (wHTH) protein
VRIAFAEYVVDTDSRELLKNGAAVPLSPKAFQLLLMLLEQRPRALARAALYSRLWPDTLVVEANLSNLVGEIRSALGDEPRQARFIRTVHRFGYAFRAEPAAEAPVAAPPAGEVRGAWLRLSWRGGKAALGEGEHVVGRDPDLPVCLPSPSVSRRHALVRVQAGRATAEDLGSKNGTFLNGHRVREARPLAAGDILRAGSVEMKVGVVAAPGSTETGISRENE